jgi:hypothetical protein
MWCPNCERQLDRGPGHRRLSCQGFQQAQNGGPAPARGREGSRATEKQILEDADHLVAVWNERQAKRMPMLFSPTIGAAIRLLVPPKALPGRPHASSK